MGPRVVWGSCIIQWFSQLIYQTTRQNNFSQALLSSWRRVLVKHPNILNPRLCCLGRPRQVNRFLIWGSANIDPLNHINTQKAILMTITQAQCHKIANQMNALHSSRLSRNYNVHIHTYVLKNHFHQNITATCGYTELIQKEYLLEKIFSCFH